MMEGDSSLLRRLADSLRMTVDGDEQGVEWKGGLPPFHSTPIPSQK